MLNNPFHRHRIKHAQTVVRIGLFFLWAASIGIAIAFGMRPSGIIAFGVLYLFGVLLIESIMEHY